jgi:hypothetical protein
MSHLSRYLAETVACGCVSIPACGRLRSPVLKRQYRLWKVAMQTRQSRSGRCTVDIPNCAWQSGILAARGRYGNKQRGVISRHRRPRPFQKQVKPLPHSDLGVGPWPARDIWRSTAVVWRGEARYVYAYTSWRVHTLRHRTLLQWQDVLTSDVGFKLMSHMRLYCEEGNAPMRRCRAFRSAKTIRPTRYRTIRSRGYIKAQTQGSRSDSQQFIYTRINQTVTRH